MYEGHGFIVDGPFNRVRWVPKKDGPGRFPVVSEVDLFHGFDLAAYRPLSAGVVHPIHLIQVTTDKATHQGSRIRERRRKIEALDMPVPLVTPLLWGFVPRKPWKVWFQVAHDGGGFQWIGPVEIGKKGDGFDALLAGVERHTFKLNIVQDFKRKWNGVNTPEVK